MKQFMFKAMRVLITVLPIMTMLAVTASANTIASPFCGQPNPPENLKKYRKF